MKDWFIIELLLVKAMAPKNGKTVVYEYYYDDCGMKCYYVGGTWPMGRVRSWFKRILRNKTK